MYLIKTKHYYCSLHMKTYKKLNKNNGYRIQKISDHCFYILRFVINILIILLLSNKFDLFSNFECLKKKIL